MNYLQPFTYIKQLSGKQMGDKLADAVNYCFKIPTDKLMAIKDILNIVHNSSLLIDDIEDNSVLRRGIPTTHSVFGVARTLNTSFYMYLVAYERILNLGHPMAVKVFTEQGLKAHHGQGMELYWRDNYICPTEEEYKQMATIRTGSGFQLNNKLIQLFSENISDDYSKLFGMLGLYYQIRDDYCNLCSPEYLEKKDIYDDLTEGKFGFPIIHAIRTHPEDDQVMCILRKRTSDVNMKKYCVKLLETFGSFEYTRNVLMEMDADIRKEVENCGGNPLIITILDGLKI